MSVNAAFVGTVYHGLSRIFDLADFRSTSEGQYGGGWYFSESLDVAADYGCDTGCVIRARLSLRRPFYYAADDVHDLPYESFAINLAQTFIDDAEAFIERQLGNDGLYFDWCLTAAMRNAGHDGLVVTYPGCVAREIVAFNRPSIHCLSFMSHERQALGVDYQRVARLVPVE
ncbi:hypothetical protein A3709_19125 [Halioglobus sp. HI00S01]|uniref:hypothetical protein n=1 Tax=Halioglobus sp. HI00S01 TaxID=1822214 RepID=UPI0007C30433|nr:hypothetical protein [Halioglobus sp. HI00S01]KZX57738.1 hypothetical protein A3709_19125 [Halioglobus sp. HI00S01]